jgi:predicted component of type VI protein secretion system
LNIHTTFDLHNLEFPHKNWESLTLNKSARSNSEKRIRSKQSTVKYFYLVDQRLHKKVKSFLLDEALPVVSENLQQTLHHPVQQSQQLRLSVGAEELLGAALVAHLQQVRRLLHVDWHKDREKSLQLVGKRGDDSGSRTRN